MDVLVKMISFGLIISRLEGLAILNVPSAGKCGNETVLRCDVDSKIESTAWYNSTDAFIINGTAVKPEDWNKYKETRGTLSFNLTIHNTSISDEGYYRCGNNFYRSSSVRLKIECQASASVLAVTNGKKVVITVDKLYPASPTLIVSFNKENYNTFIPGTWNCSSSTQYQGYYRCVWTSSNSLADGSYNYSLLVTTITQADPLTGSFNIVSPQTPTISNVVKLNDNREVIYGNEGQSLTIQCTSVGGYPSPTVVWYSNSISSSIQIASTSTGTFLGNGTYNVTLQYKFTPSTSDDRTTLICRSYYPQADTAHRGSNNKSVILYLRLRPSRPVAVQAKVVSSGDTVEVSCNTTGCRPAANMSWSYQGSTTTGEVTSTIDATSETYTVVSLFRRQVTSADNGHTVQCIVTHPALISPSEKTTSVKLNVNFSVRPSSTRITGNKEIIATGQTALTLTCTTGSSNPASDIRWKNGSVTLTSNRPYTETTGDNNGLVRSQQLILYPTRYMDGDVIICSVSNIVSQSDVTLTTTLNLKYRPLIEPMPEVISVEGNNSILTCVASSKPVSTFQWYREGQSGILSQGTGTLASNKLTYTIRNVRRTAAATYRCNANNGIETADNENVLLTVYYPPVVTAVTTNTTIEATTALIKCNAKGVPNSNYRYGKWIQTWPGYNIPVSEKPGNERLTLTDLTYEHSGVYTCSASNGIKVFGTQKEFMEGSVYLLVKSYPIITQFSEITPVRLKENATFEVYYYSNVARSEVKVFRNVNGSRKAGVIYTVTESHAVVDLLVFSHTIRTGGTRARIFMKIKSKDDFGFYDVVVSNEIDSNSRTFETVPKGPPSDPFDIKVDNIQQNTARVSWIPGFHGGFAQTFLIQLSTDRKHWRNEETVYGGTDESEEPMYKVLINLQESTIYYVRMYAFNSEGNSPFSEIHNFTTLIIREVQGNSAAVTAGAVGGAISVIVIAVIVVIVVLVRREIITKDSIRSRYQTATSCFGEKQKKEAEVEIDGQINTIRMYEHLKHTTDSGQTNVYDALQLDREVTDTSKVQYENLPKKKSKSPIYMNISAGKQNRKVNQTYENLKLPSNMTDGK
ncbi:hemicentin-1-like isoform X1 [Mercenaria mercenaria]|uniref:hemicentin-1-like isoform X1 n=2 Tax=Mercenaria mercenaria TaxID=6596 RepID=UPI00234E5274|nr:hemicentin-1-like isoform X1 [Mercenaria mercenaria]